MKQAHASTKSYTIGYILSVALTLVAFVIVNNKLVSGNSLVVALISLAVVQLWVQVTFFLHLGRDAKVRWNLMAFLFMLMVVLIIAVGSIWIMNNLNYGHDHEGNTLSDPQQTDEYIIQDERVQ